MLKLAPKDEPNVPVPYVMRQGAPLLAVARLIAPTLIMGYYILWRWLSEAPFSATFTLIEGVEIPPSGPRLGKLLEKLVLLGI